MAQETLVTPPIRQSLEDTKSAQANGIAQPATEKSWYLFFDRLRQMANQQGSMITSGTHANRPPASVMPDGAIYVETDRGVIYQKIAGSWVYLAGTMWNTVNPDKRPTDLSQPDSNFDYRGTDIAREFIWTGYKWVETTIVRYGLHADRLALNLANVIDGELFVEWDRKYVMYQAQGGTWHYVGGTMFGTLSPDQRPTDLGANDAGFDFRGTDQQREFLWSQTAWVEVTPAWSRGTGGAIYYNGGNVGIGTATPAAPLNVKYGPNPDSTGQPAGPWAAIIYNANNTPSENGLLVKNNWAAASSTVFQVGLDGVGGAFRSFLLVDGAGNVGIGTASATYRLDVVGDANCSGIYRRAGVAGVTATITTAKLTTAGANGSLTFSGGILTGFVQPT